MRLSYRELKALEIWQKYLNGDIENDYKDSQRILEALIVLQQAVVDSKIKGPDWKMWVDSLTTKFILHTNSILNISRGTQLKIQSLGKDLNIIDIPTMLIVFRAQLECFLMFDFIYIQPNSDNEKEFRYWNWKYDNLLMRRKIPAKSNIIKIQQKDDLLEIGESARARGVNGGRPAGSYNKKKASAVVALYNQKNTINFIEDNLNISRSTIYQYLRKEGVKINGFTKSKIY